MSTIPPTRVGALEFFETHLPLWAAAPTTIGLSLEAVTDLQAFVSTARTKWDEAQAARVASKGATEGFYNAIDTLREAGGAAIGEIRAFARSTQNPDVYIAAGIPAPASPSPAPPPSAPTNLTVSMQTTGQAV